MVGCTLVCRIVICWFDGCVGPVREEDVDAAAVVARVLVLLLAVLVLLLMCAGRGAAITVPIGVLAPLVEVVIDAAAVGDIIH